MKIHLFLAGALMHLSHTTAAMEQDSEVSYSREAGLTWLRELAADNSKILSRNRRVIGIPLGSNIEVRWSLNLPFNTFTLYGGVLNIGIPVKFPMPEAFIVGGSFKKRSVGGPDEGPDDFPNDNPDIIDALPERYTYWYQNDKGSQLERYSRSRRASRQERLFLYKYMETAFNKAGVDGRTCLLRAICEVADAPFDQGLLGKMINTFLAASTAGRPDTVEERKEYDLFIEAELHGKVTGRCEERYHQCHTSPFDLIPYMVHTLS
ncbi:uncharacterized protein [Cherax quadricarinatus]|uniref:uncharacterized protein n=1 Tax=Cherax quadricarinatus TaxID=27406 RepID=UPI00387E5910